MANSVDLDQMPCSAVSDLGLHSLPQYYGNLFCAFIVYLYHVYPK